MYFKFEQKNLNLAEDSQEVSILNANFKSAVETFSLVC